jgi:hypothetical protein
MKTKEKQPIYYSVKETVDLTGWNKSLVMRKIKSGEIKAVKIGWVWAVLKDPIDKLIEESK